MAADLCVAIPAWNREKMLRECLDSLRTNVGVSMEIVVIDDRSSDGTRKVAEEYNCRIIDGPGYCNWRPGAIHWPVFQAWLTTKCPYVTYLFSDDLSFAPRLEKQIRVLREYPKFPACYTSTHLAYPSGEHKGVKIYPEVDNLPFGGIVTYTEILVINRHKFIEVGGLDYPIHAAAMAEAWIWAACGAAGKLAYVESTGFRFREHDGALTSSGKKIYPEAVLKTGFLEEDQWALWKRVEPKFHELVAKAKAHDNSPA